MSFPGSLTDPNTPQDVTDNSLYDLDHQAIDQAVAAAAGDPSEYDKKNMIDAANAVNDSAGQPYPGDILAQQGVETYPRRMDAGNGTGGTLPGAPGNPQDVVTGTTPGVSASGLPGGGGTGGTPPTGRGQLSDAEWNADWKSGLGFDPVAAYNGRGNFLANAQAGDRTIRGGALAGGTGPDQLAAMALRDSDAQRILDAINKHPDFYNAPSQAEHSRLHNQDLSNQLAQMSGVSQQQAAAQGFNGQLGAPSRPAPAGTNAAWLHSQFENVPTNPATNAQAFPDGTKLVGELAQLKGVTLAPDPIDSYGNIVFTENGQIRHIPITEWGNWQSVISERLAAQNAPPAAGGGGGGRGYPPRGGGGGYQPPAAGGGGAPFTPADLYGPKPPNMAGYGPLDANRFGNAGNTNFQPTQSVMPGGGWHIDPQQGLVSDANTLPENIASGARNVLGGVRDVILGSNNNSTADGWWSEDGVFHPTNP